MIFNFHFLGLVCWSQHDGTGKDESNNHRNGGAGLRGGVRTTGKRHERVEERKVGKLDTTRPAAVVRWNGNEG